MTNVDLDVCVVGSSNLDLVVRVERHPTVGETVAGSEYRELPGGKGLNQAVAASRAGARTAFVTCVGDDDAGHLLRHVMAADGLPARPVRSASGSTGRALVVVGDDGSNAIVVVPGANALLDQKWIGVHGPLVATAQVVLAQLEIPIAVVVAAFEVARAVGATTVLNPAPADDVPDELLRLADIIVPNEHELAVLGGMNRLRRLAAGAVVVTEGARGARVVRGDSEVLVPSFAVATVDTTGAGDAFCGALCARLAAGDEILAAVRFACAAGALATTVAGAVPSMPASDAISVLLSGRA